MSNLTIVLTCVLLSFLACAIFMSAYKEDIFNQMNALRIRLNDAWTQIHILQDQLYVHTAKIYDLENKVNEITKEMEKLDDGK